MFLTAFLHVLVHLVLRYTTWMTLLKISYIMYVSISKQRARKFSKFLRRSISTLPGKEKDVFSFQKLRCMPATGWVGSTMNAGHTHLIHTSLILLQLPRTWGWVPDCSDSVCILPSTLILTLITHALSKSGQQSPTMGGQWRTQEFFFGGGVQQIQLMTDDREDRDLGAVAP